MKRILAAVFVILLAAGCATAPPKPVWVAAESTYTAGKLNFAVDLPAGWMRLNTEDGVRITRDGFSLQVIGVDRYKVGDSLKNTKKKFEKGMLPQEVSAILIDNMTLAEGVASSDVMENVPKQFAGIDGFRVLLRLHLKNGEERRYAFYGGMSEDWVFEIYYSAPRRYYFERDLETFEGVARSFRLIKPLQAKASGKGGGRHRVANGA
ncbi:MAG: hypothetical protein P8175_14965 [Deltaproteobacteria bacterium]